MNGLRLISVSSAEIFNIMNALLFQVLLLLLSNRKSHPYNLLLYFQRKLGNSDLKARKTALSTTNLLTVRQVAASPPYMDGSIVFVR